jgi:putative Mg2+ transporter-C (MgtC) family protein
MTDRSRMRIAAIAAIVVAPSIVLAQAPPAALGNPFTDELLFLPEPMQVARIAIRLLIAALLGGLLGAQREAVGKAAGLRTHMLVAVGAAMFVLVPADMNVGQGDLGRAIQGVATGVGFLGAGAILKDGRQVSGLTTAAGIWLTAAIGVAVGAGRLWLPILCAIMALAILSWLTRVERRINEATGRDAGR